MTGSVTINGTRYQVTIEDLTPADVLPVFRTDTSILKTDSLLLHAAGTEQNSAKKVLMTHLVSMLAASVAEDNVLTIEPYYDENGVYQGMYWHFNSDWLRRNDTGEMIRVDDTAAEIALAADQAVRATEAAKTAEKERQQQETTRQQQEDNRVTEFASLKSASEQATSNANTAAGNANQKAQEANTARQNAQAAADEWNNTYKQQIADATRYALQQGDYAKAQGDYAKWRGDYPDQIRSDGYVWTYAPDDEGAGEDGYKRTAYKVDAALDFDALTPEQYQSLIDNIKAGMVYATVATCESIIDELT